MNALIPRNTVEQIVSFRDAAVAAYQAAFDKIADADHALKEASLLWSSAAGNCASLPYGDKAQEVDAFFKAVRLPDREQWCRTAIRLIDISVWNHLVQMTELETLMDRKAKDELRESLRWVPEEWRHGRGDSRELVNLDKLVGIPPVTVDNIYATIEKWAGEAEMIFRRGIAVAFSSLDRRFRSHDGFKIGGRVILTNATNSYSASFDEWSRTGETIRDIERTFLVLDGRGRGASYGGICGQIRLERTHYGPHESRHEGEYFRIVLYKNGNAHLWFTRDDLVTKVNKLLAEYYGEVIGDGQTHDDDLFRNIKRTPAKRFGFFPTPDEAAKAVMEKVWIHPRAEEPQLTILEPSAGTGNLARRCIIRPDKVEGHEWERERTERHNREYRFDNQVDCVEIQPHLAAALQAERIYRKVYAKDFLALTPATTGLYDRVVMNPPFDLERDIDHVMHAMQFLKPDGQLVAIMSAGTEFRETRKSKAFRDHMAKLNAQWRDLPAGSFAESGTYVNTLMLAVCKDGRRQSSWW
jgi:hypothetical protein